MALGTQQSLCGWRRHPPLGQPILPLILPGPFSGEKRNYGARGFQRGPRGQRCSSPGAPCLAVIWAPEKYRRPWLTELLFRFEPATPFDSDAAGQGKRFPKPLGVFVGPASPEGRGARSAAAPQTRRPPCRRAAPPGAAPPLRPPRAPAAPPGAAPPLRPPPPRRSRPARSRSAPAPPRPRRSRAARSPSAPAPPARPRRAGRAREPAPLRGPRGGPGASGVHKARA